ncbi:MAG: trypsin-like peptidase domain-containing protein [Bifidobacteriaceae bacterium]|nr:trypsin-like peptidase domain-containing protein [Bifidobacteriaceae bacterium]
MVDFDNENFGDSPSKQSENSVDQKAQNNQASENMTQNNAEMSDVQTNNLQPPQFADPQQATPSYSLAPEYGAYSNEPVNAAPTADMQSTFEQTSFDANFAPATSEFNPYAQNSEQNAQNNFVNDGEQTNVFDTATFSNNGDQNADPNAVPGFQPDLKQHKRGSNIVTAFVVAVVTAALTLGVGFAVISTGLVAVPSTGQLSSVSSNTSGSGTAKVADGKSVDWTTVAKNVSSSVVSIQAQLSGGVAAGSGAIVDTRGYVVTNNHVISGASAIQVTLANGQIYAADIVGTDTSTDLAVLKLQNPPSDLTAVSFANSDNLAVGESVMAIGNPLGYDNTATTGIVSALHRPVTVMENNAEIVTNAVQIDAAINRGNSGGPTFNAAGEVIGINSSIATDSSSSSSSSSSGSIGIGFAIPSNLVKHVVESIIKDGSVTHVVLGATIRTTTVTVGSVTRGGVSVVSVTDGSSAAAAGLKAGDVIVAYNGNATTTTYSLLGYIRAASLNDKVKLTVVRNGSTQDIEVTLNHAESKVTGSNRSNSSDNSNSQNNENNNDGDESINPFSLQ